MAAQSISALNATLPLSSDHSSFISKSSTFPKIHKPKAIPIRFSTKASRTPVSTSFPTSQNTKRIMNDPQAYNTYTIPYSKSYSNGRTLWEIKERETEYKLRFDMPGMSRDDVKMWVEENMLMIQAEKAQKMKQDNNSSSTNSAVQEQEEEEEWPAKSYGKYQRVIALPENIEFEKIKAEVKDGVLYITIPKASVSAKILNISVQ